MTGHTKSFLSSLLIVGALAGGAGVAVAGPARAPSAITAASRQVQTTHAPTSAKQWDQTAKSFAHIYVTSYHVTSYQGYVGITQYYGLSQKTLHEEMDWQDQQQVAPSSEELKNWLEGHGCKLDNLDGPAVIVLQLSNSGEMCQTFEANQVLSGTGFVAIFWAKTNRFPRGVVEITLQ